MPLRDIERNYIAGVLKETKGHRSKAAKILQISERSLYRKIREFGIE
jgi:DNA-binding NtrC family response regulator